MDFLGFDLGKRSSQVGILTEDGELIERRIKTDREHISELLGSRPPARLLIEASTESEWVARHLGEPSKLLRKSPTKTALLFHCFTTPPAPPSGRRPRGGRAGR